jgi:3-phenylpropionate/cinnamic acid dioxygenase small subunit
MTQELKVLAAEREIERLLFRYCRAMDDGRFDDFARLFENGTWYFDEATQMTGSDEVRAWLEDSIVLYNGVPGTRHTVSNIVTDVDLEEGTASSRSYVIVFQTIPGSAPHVMFQGAYDDTLVLGPGGWRFAERRLTCDGLADMTVHLKGAGAQTISA